MVTVLVRLPPETVTLPVLDAEDVFSVTEIEMVPLLVPEVGLTVIQDWLSVTDQLRLEVIVAVFVPAEAVYSETLETVSASAGGAELHVFALPEAVKKQAPMVSPTVLFVNGIGFVAVPLPPETSCAPTSLLLVGRTRPSTS